MDTIWSQKSDAILKVGRSLEDIGIRNWALTLEQALIALDQFEVEGIAILGGDVYELQEGALQSNYDNWHCDKRPNESKSDFMARSIARARAYITNYKGNQGVQYFFAIVPEF